MDGVRSPRPRELGPETIIIARSGERIEWFACGRKGSYLVRGLGKTPKLSLFARGKSVMSQFRKGRLKAADLVRLRAFVPAPPLFRIARPSR